MSVSKHSETIGEEQRAVARGCAWWETSARQRASEAWRGEDGRKNGVARGAPLRGRMAMAPPAATRHAHRTRGAAGAVSRTKLGGLSSAQVLTAAPSTSFSLLYLCIPLPNLPLLLTYPPGSGGAARLIRLSCATPHFTRWRAMTRHTPQAAITSLLDRRRLCLHVL